MKVKSAISWLNRKHILNHLFTWKKAKHDNSHSRPMRKLLLFHNQSLSFCHWVKSLSIESQNSSSFHNLKSQDWTPLDVLRSLPSEYEALECLVVKYPSLSLVGRILWWNSSQILWEKHYWCFDHWDLAIRNESQMSCFGCNHHSKSDKSQFTLFNQYKPLELLLILSSTARIIVKAWVYLLKIVSVLSFLSLSWVIYLFVNNQIS